MAKNSKFHDKQIEEILKDMIVVIEKHKAPIDLSLVVLGNMVTNLLQNNVGKQQQKILAEAFSKALIDSIKDEK